MPSVAISEVFVPNVTVDAVLRHLTANLATLRAFGSNDPRRTPWCGGRALADDALRRPGHIAPPR